MSFIAAFRGVRSLETRGFGAAGVFAGADADAGLGAGGCCDDDDALLVAVLAKLVLDCCASFSGTENGDVVAEGWFGGGLVGSGGGDSIGRVIEVSGAEAFRGAVGGCEGNG